MTEFIKIDEYLTRKLKENCEDLEKFVLEYVDQTDEISLANIGASNVFTRDKVKKGFERDYKLFKKHNETFSETVSSIYDKGLEKIDNFVEHKYNLFLIKYELHEGEVDKKTLLKWLLGNEL